VCVCVCVCVCVFISGRPMDKDMVKIEDDIDDVNRPMMLKGGEYE